MKSKLTKKRVPLLLATETHDRLREIADQRNLQTGTLCGQVLDTVSRIDPDQYEQVLAAIAALAIKKK